MLEQLLLGRVIRYKFTLDCENPRSPTREQFSPGVWEFNSFDVVSRDEELEEGGNAM